MKIFGKKTLIFPVWNLIPQPCKQKENYILPLEKDFKTLKEIIIGTAGTKPFESFTIFQSGQNSGKVKYEHLMLLGAFLNKMTFAIDFTDEAVVQYDVPVVKILFLGDGN